MGCIPALDGFIYKRHYNFLSMDANPISEPFPRSQQVSRTWFQKLAVPWFKIETYENGDEF